MEVINGSLWGSTHVAVATTVNGLEKSVDPFPATESVQVGGWFEVTVTVAVLLFTAPATLNTCTQ